MKVIFMGTPDFAVPTLEKLFHDENFEIKLVVSQGDRRRGRGKAMQFPRIKEKALELGLDLYQPENINSEESIEKIKDIGPDFIIVAAFGQILKKEILSIPKYGCINVHASLLPKYRGAAPINWSIISGENTTGITIMEMDEGLDTGHMLNKISIAIEPLDDYPSLHDKLSKAGGDILIQTLMEIVAGNVKREVQDDSLSSYAPMIFRDTGEIDWNKSANDIVNKIRGLKPWPTAHTIYKDDIVKIHLAQVLDESLGEIPGEIVKVCDQGVYVSTGDKTLLIEELQFPNKKKMSVKDYLRGNTIDRGIILGKRRGE